MVEGMKGEINRKRRCALGLDHGPFAGKARPVDRVLTVLYLYYQAV
jgi:hypothetical protein